jgi:class 3 adenylate cyclase
MIASSVAPSMDRALATIMFTDIVDSTDRLVAVGDRRWRQLLDRHDAIVGNHLERHLGTYVKGTGDGILATFCIPSQAIACAFQIRAALRTMGLDVRAGIHTGEVELRGDDVAGVAVHLAARVAMLARAGEVLVSRTVLDLVEGSGIQFEDAGEHSLKGMPSRQRVFAAIDWRQPESRAASRMVMVRACEVAGENRCAAAQPRPALSMPRGGESAARTRPAQPIGPQDSRM